MFSKESNATKQSKVLMNARFMNFWDLIIDNHISEAIAFFKNPAGVKDENDLDMENAPQSSINANSTEMLNVKQADYSLALDNQVSEKVRRSVNFSKSENKEIFCTQIHFLTSRYKNE